MSPSVKSEAVVLRTYDLREKDLIAVFLTRAAGKVRGVARGARGGRVRRFGGALQPGTVVHLDWFEREKADLARIDECVVVRSYFAEAGADLRLSFLQAYFLELADGLTVEHDPQEDLYRLLRLALEQAVGAGEGRLTVRRYYEFWLLRLTGFFPALGRCPGCGRLLEEGRVRWLHPGEGILCPRCSRGRSPRWKLGGPAAGRLVGFLRRRLEEVLASTAGPELGVDAALEEPLVGLLRHHLGREIRSLSFLRR